MEQKTIKTFKDLAVWQKSIKLVEFVYNLTSSFPKEEAFGLTSQIRRCAVSIPSNIAEGKGRGTRRDYRQFLLIAYGSASELETQLIIGSKLGYLSEKDYKTTSKLIVEVSKMLMTMIRRLENE